VSQNSFAPDENIFRALLEAAPDPIIVVNESGMMVLVNSQTEKVLGYTRNDLVGQRIEMLLPEDLRAGHVGRREGYVQKPKTRPMGVGLDLKARRRDGSLLPVEISLSPVETNDGRYFISVLRDVTERKMHEAKLSAYAEDLARSNSDLEQFAYVASHDLQEPLRIISGYCQLFERRYKSLLDDDGRKYLGYMNDGALRMQDLIADLLSWSRVSSKARELTPLDLNQCLDAALNNLGLFINEQGATVERDELPRIKGDLNQLVQLFQNLIGNAVKFRGQNSPAVRIGVEKRADMWVIKVSDNGIGFDMQYADRIFTIFQRLHSREQYKGTGIGLAICKKVVERHGGKIWVESRQGYGTTFYFSLPMLNE
jgi:PAS domain S-box-containing protein